MGRTFLDVGAHNGQTLAAILPVGFDRIVCFEPVPACWPHLKQFTDPRLKLEKFGLWNKTASAMVHKPGAKGAGMWRKDKEARPTPTQACDFVRASEWFAANVSADETVYMKLNVEGAECDIVDDLLDSGEFAKVAYVMIDFDVRKIGALKHREAETRKRLEPYPFPRVAYCRDVMKGETHQARIRNWLKATVA